jgi:hypothetical protein
MIRTGACGLAADPENAIVYLLRPGRDVRLLHEGDRPRVLQLE